MPLRRHGFTLIEILIVVGIIAVLAGLLLTVRSRASDKATQTMCLNNLRQIGMAMTMYAQANEQAFPFGAPADVPQDRPEDWIHFRAGPTDLPTKVNGSAIAKFSNVKGNAFISIMRCPADDVENHQVDSRTGVPYRFSYSMNYAMTSDPAWGKHFNYRATPRVTAIERPAEKILVAEENERSINDGLWVGGTYAPPDNRQSKWNITYDYLSVRHDNSAKEFKDPGTFNGLLYGHNKRGNVLFVDGHTDFISRSVAHHPRHVVVRDEGTGKPDLAPNDGN